MIISILASTSAGGIGSRGTLPWPKNSEDLKWFKEHTTGNIVVMGRKTWNDPMMPKPLPNRVNCVVSNRIINNINVRRLHGDIRQEVLDLQAQFPQKDIYIIGGKTIYEATSDIVEKIYLTRIKGNWRADTYINLDLMLMNFRVATIKPGKECTYETWKKIEK